VEKGHLEQLVQLLGTTGAAGTLFLGTIAFFSFLDRFSSKQARADLSTFIKSDMLAILPTVAPAINFLFERVFGNRHLSSRAIASSIAFSLGATLSLLLVFFFRRPQRISNLVRLFSQPRFFISFSSSLVDCGCLHRLL